MEENDEFIKKVRMRLLWYGLNNDHFERHGSHCPPSCLTAKMLYKMGEQIGISEDQLHNLTMICRRVVKCK